MNRQLRRDTIRHAFWMVGLVAADLASANDQPMPVAVRWWGQAMVSVETYWNLSVVVDPHGRQLSATVPVRTADAVLVTHEDSDLNSAALVGGEPKVMRGFDANGAVRDVKLVVDRLPNQPEIAYRLGGPRPTDSPRRIAVQTVATRHDIRGSGQPGAAAIFVIDVEGVRIVHCSDLGEARLSKQQLASLGRVDVLLAPVGGQSTVDARQARAIVRQVAPRILVPIHDQTEAQTAPLDPVDAFVEALAVESSIERPSGNTLAVRATDGDSDAATRIVVLSDRPWRPDGELDKLMDRMEAACRQSQAVFEPLSVDQMNFRPPNGTHTPRWNAEHMMGRQLLFFTQIFSALSDEFRTVDLNPAQMPPDYEAAHPDWDGAEEARQMERATALVRRFAYLLDGVPLDQRTPGSRWTLRGLLQQMERHFGEHTANVKRKFELPQWPQ
ncbi:MAG: MBL fold metallo-hydrolase [Planctomycetota bacterium]